MQVHGTFVDNENVKGIVDNCRFNFLHDCGSQAGRERLGAVLPLWDQARDMRVNEGSISPSLVSEIIEVSEQLNEAVKAYNESMNSGPSAYEGLNDDIWECYRETLGSSSYYPTKK